MLRKINVVLLVMVMMAGTLGATPLLRELCVDLIGKNDGKSVVEGADGWLFLKDELIHVSSGRFWGGDAQKATRSKKKEYADPIPAIVSYNKALAEKGITLYLMPVPPKALVYPEKLAEGVIPGGVDEERGLYTQFYKELEKNGVNVIDLLPQLVDKAAKINVYCKTDTHFSGEGISLFASRAAEVIKGEPWYDAVPKQAFSQKEQLVSIVGDLSQMAGKTDGEDLNLSIVTTKESTPVVSDKTSPVILLGDSHTLVFSAGGDLHAKSAGLFDHLSADLGFSVDLLGVRGSGITPARVKLFQRSKKNPDYLSGKKALIWCFTAREFTGTGGWREIPVAGK